MEHCASEQGEERAIFAQLLKVLLTQASGCLFDQSEQEYEYDFCQKWERMADLFTPTSNLLSYPVSQDLPHLKKFLSAQAAVKVSADQCITEPFKETVQSVILTPSCYVRSLPEPVVPQNEHKMLMYWENYIIPKMQDYVRGSLKPWELLDFFEQIR
jgi:other hect domain ubiquitin protein ligase E3